MSAVAIGFTSVVNQLLIGFTKSSPENPVVVSLNTECGGILVEGGIDCGKTQAVLGILSYAAANPVATVMVCTEQVELYERSLRRGYSDGYTLVTSSDLSITRAYSIYMARKNGGKAETIVYVVVDGLERLGADGTAKLRQMLVDGPKFGVWVIAETFMDVDLCDLPFTVVISKSRKGPQALLSVKEMDTFKNYGTIYCAL